MQRTIRTIAVMALAPPLLIYPLAQLRILLSTSGQLRIASILVAVWSIGMAALLTSKWRVPVMIAVGIAYSFISLFLLPMLALSASCMVGPCL